MKKTNKNLTEGKIGNQLLNLTWPMIMGMLGMVIFNIVDMYFVGMLGVPQLAALSFTFPVIMLIVGISSGIGVATSSLIARNIIATDRNEVKKMSSQALLFGFIIVVLFVIGGYFTIQPVFYLLGANSDIIQYIADYMEIWYLGVPFVVIPMIGNNIVRATGDTFLPGMLMISSGIVNAIIDPFLIFGYGPFPEMGLKGAALATVIARSTSLIFILVVLIKRENLLTIHFGKLKEISTTWKALIHIAVPASLSTLITPISIGLITKIISGFGKEAVAAFGVASKVEMFGLIVIASLGSVLIIFIGQNVSKQKFQRIYMALNYSMKFSMLWGILFYVALLFFGSFIISVFTDDLMVISIAKKYFYIIGASYGFQGLVMLSTASFNGINKPYPSAVLSLIRMLVLYVPLAWFGSRILGIDGMFWAAFFVNIVVGLISFFYLKRTIRKISASNSC